MFLIDTLKDVVAVQAAYSDVFMKHPKAYSIDNLPPCLRLYDTLLVVCGLRPSRWPLVDAKWQIFLILLYAFTVISFPLPIFMETGSPWDRFIWGDMTLVFGKARHIFAYSGPYGQFTVVLYGSVNLYVTYVRKTKWWTAWIKLLKFRDWDSIPGLYTAADKLKLWKFIYVTHLQGIMSGLNVGFWVYLFTSYALLRGFPWHLPFSEMGWYLAADLAWVALYILSESMIFLFLTVYIAALISQCLYYALRIRNITASMERINSTFRLTRSYGIQAKLLNRLIGHVKDMDEIRKEFKAQEEDLSSLLGVYVMLVLSFILIWIFITTWVADDNFIVVIFGSTVLANYISVILLVLFCAADVEYSHGNYMSTLYVSFTRAPIYPTFRPHRKIMRQIYRAHDEFQLRCWVFFAVDYYVIFEVIMESMGYYLLYISTITIPTKE